MIAATSSAEATHELAGAISELVRAGDLIVLAGDLGAGKTAFAQGFGARLGIDEPITSPTFTLVSQYRSGRVMLYHLDVYRLDALEEVADLGLVELLDDDAVTLIEWGDTITPALPADFLEISLTMGQGDDDRILTFSSVGQRWAARRRALATVLAPWLVAAGTHDPLEDPPC